MEVLDGRRAVIIDGDTFAIGAEKVRILNIDAPESFRSRCEAELALALRAKERLADLLWFDLVTIERDGWDRYGRTLAWVRTTPGDSGRS